MIKKYIFSILLLFCMGNLSAQTLVQAKKMFESNEFEKAKTAFSKLIKRTPNHAETNFYYGASLYETGEIEKALPYLEKSANRKYIAAYRYLGKAYADLFRFDEAIENYETHIEWLEEKKRDSQMAKTELSTLRFKARMLKNVEKVTVIDSFVVSKQQLLDTYKISLSSGKIEMNANKNGTIYEDEMVRMILDINPASKGHALILPKQHYANVYEIDEDTLTHIIKIAKRAGTQMQAALNCDGLNILQNNGEAAGQTVFHFHMHVIPRYENDTVSVQLGNGILNDDDKEELVKKLSF